MRTYLSIITLVGLIITGCTNSNQFTQPIKKELIKAVYASGRLFPKKHYKVVSKFSAYVSSICVKHGQHVKKGDTLAILKNESLQNNLKIAINNYELAQKNAEANSPLLKAAQSEYNIALTKFNNDSVNYFRFQNLINQNATTKQQVDIAKTQYETSTQNLLKAKFNLQNIRDKINTDLQNAKENLELIKNNSEEFILKSEINGKVYNIDLEIGELVNPNKILFELGDDAEFEVELNIDESDVNFLKAEQEVFYTIDAFGEKTFSGHVIEIYPSINNINRTCKAIASIEKNEKFINGMSVEANIIIERKKDVLVIPREFLINNRQVQVKGEKELRVVKTGISDLEYVEITEGLTTADVLIKK